MNKSRTTNLRGATLHLELDTDGPRAQVLVSCEVPGDTKIHTTIDYVGGEWIDHKDRRHHGTLLDAIKHACHDWPPIASGTDLIDQFNCLPDMIL